jgi:hypothetical protein
MNTLIIIFVFALIFYCISAIIIDYKSMKKSKKNRMEVFFNSMAESEKISNEINIKKAEQYLKSKEFEIDLLIVLIHEHEKLEEFEKCKVLKEHLDKIKNSK